MKTVDKYVTIEDDTNLRCPICQGFCLHQGAVTTYFRKEDEEKTMVSEISIEGVSVINTSSNDCGNPSSRRHGLRINMSCEGCGDIPSLLIYQHKGTTYIEWAPTS
jgi:hypothetical protein